MNRRLQRVASWLGRNEPAEAAIDEGYRWLLGRPADKAGLEWLGSRLRDVSPDQMREQIRAVLIGSPEFAQRHPSPSARADCRDRLTEARIGGFDYLVVRGDFTEVAGSQGTYESNVLGSLLDDAAEADVIVDVGANIGLIAVPMAAVQRSGGKIYCLEISQLNVKVLLENARRNALDNIVAFPIGASDRFETTPMQLHPSATLNTLSAVASDLFAERTEMVLALPLDAIFADSRFGKVDIIKIDTDGYEYRVLRGAERLLNAHKPIVYLEYCPQLSEQVLGVAGEEMLKLLASHGYQATILHRGEPPERLGALPVEQMVARVTELWQRDMAIGITHLDIRWHVADG